MKIHTCNGHLHWKWNLNWHCVLSKKIVRGNLHPSCLIYIFWMAWNLFCIRKSQRYVHWHNICIWLVSSAIPFGGINPEFRIFCDSVREHQPGVSYLLRFRSGASTRSLVSSMIPFGSINSESRILLRFRSGVSTRSLVFFFLTIPFEKSDHF